MGRDGSQDRIGLLQFSMDFSATLRKDRCNMRNQKDDERKRIDGERSSAIERIAMRLDSFGGLRPDLRAEMKAIMTLPE